MSNDQVVKPMDEIKGLPYDRGEPKVELTEEQTKVVEAVRDWFVNPTEVIKIGGYAGTGKTTITIELMRLLRNDFKDRKNKYMRSQLMAYTGKASAVLTKKSKLSASTIHRAIYKPRIDPETKRIKGWDKVPFLDANLLVIDEASMVPGDIYKDLVSYGIPIIAIGDHGQLPPVKGEFNLMEHPDLALQQIHRNANGIAKTAEVIRHGGLVPFGEVNENVLKLDTRLWRGWADAPEEVKEAVFNPSPDKLFITAKNKNRVDANTSIRGNLLETSMMSAVEAIGPQPNDRVICVRNNWNLGIHNGMLGTIKAIEHKADDIWHIEFLPDGEYLSDEFDITDYFFNKEQYREPLDHVIGNGLGRFDYGYCITCHKAQGSEAKIVAVFGQGFGSPDLKRRWMYTAVTRAKDRCLILYH